MVGWRARSERRRPWRSGGMCDARPRTKVDQLSPNLNPSLVAPLTNHRLCPNQEEPVAGVICLSNIVHLLAQETAKNLSYCISQ